MYEVPFLLFHHHFKSRIMVWDLVKGEKYLLFVKSAHSNLFGNDPNLTYYVGVVELLTHVNHNTIRTTVFEFDTGAGNPLQYKGSLYGAEWYTLRLV